MISGYSLIPARYSLKPCFSHDKALVDIVQITVNGEAREMADGMTVRELLQSMRLDPRYLAAEVNRQVVPRARHPEHILKPGDVVEVVTLVGGG